MVDLGTASYCQAFTALLQAAATAVQLCRSPPALLLCTVPLQAAAIVGVIPELKLEIYSLKRQDKAFAGLVGTVKDVMFKHDDAQVGQGRLLLLECFCVQAILMRGTGQGGM